MNVSSVGVTNGHAVQQTAAPQKVDPPNDGDGDAGDARQQQPALASGTGLNVNKTA